MIIRFEHKIKILITFLLIQYFADAFYFYFSNLKTTAKIRLAIALYLMKCNIWNLILDLVTRNEVSCVWHFMHQILHFLHYLLVSNFFFTNIDGFNSIFRIIASWCALSCSMFSGIYCLYQIQNVYLTHKFTPS